jgi:1,4-alpha-glucan branching enzyme
VWSQASDEADTADQTGGAGETAGPGGAADAGVTEDVAGSWDAARTGETARTEKAGAAGDAGDAQTVDVVFFLPADTAAEHVALCGEFNDWSPESISLTRGDDGSWQVTVPLAPGSYRYKYLLDGETWENGPDADRYEENAYGTVDSVIVVG